MAQNYRSFNVRLNKKNTYMQFNPANYAEQEYTSGTIDYNERIYNFIAYNQNFDMICFDVFLPDYLYTQFCRLIRKYKDFK